MTLCLLVTPSAEPRRREVAGKRNDANILVQRQTMHYAFPLLDKTKREKAGFSSREFAHSATVLWLDGDLP
jgi:hypothetical protein